jgi:alkanesulfonate monooxygenase SsuD/methylene tetrahydromethanopterin reductase-like flavin-dependent oxidoreductase (luciferase family)
MTHPLRLGIKLSQDASIDSYKAVWKIADEAHFDHCWAMDHLASIGNIGDDRPIFDGWELLAGMATSTTHVRLGLLVTGMTYRNPALLAKIATTVDHLSSGRLEFGIGAGWAVNEHEMYGISGLDHRVGVFSEGLQVIKSLWTQERTNFDGRYYTMRDAVAVPKPVQNPHPPIWVGSGGPRMLRLTARHADVWNASGNNARELQGAVAASQQLDEACTTIERSRSARTPPRSSIGCIATTRPASPRSSSCSPVARCRATPTLCRPRRGSPRTFYPRFVASSQSEPTRPAVARRGMTRA